MEENYLSEDSVQNDHTYNIPFNVDDSINYNDPGWGKLFDGWIAAMGGMLPKVEDYPELVAPMSLPSEVIHFQQPPAFLSFAGEFPLIFETKIWQYSCNQCPAKIIGGIYRYEAHIRMKHKLNCYCGEQFTSKYSLADHVNQEKELENSTLLSNYSSRSKHGHRRQKSPGRAPFECEQCGELFLTRDTAVKHRRMEHLQPPPKATKKVTSKLISSSVQRLNDRKTLKKQILKSYKVNKKNI